MKYLLYKQKVSTIKADDDTAQAVLKGVSPADVANIIDAVSKKAEILAGQNPTSFSFVTVLDSRSFRLPRLFDKKTGQSAMSLDVDNNSQFSYRVDMKKCPVMLDAIQLSAGKGHKFVVTCSLKNIDEVVARLGKENIMLDDVTNDKMDKIKDRVLAKYPYMKFASETTKARPKL